MIKRLLLFLLVLMSGVCYCPAQSKPPSGYGGGTGSSRAEYNLDKWKEFISEEGGFSILLPGVPKEVVREIDSRSGKARGHYFNLFTFAEFGFAYMELPFRVDKPEIAKKLLDDMRDGLKGRLLEEKDISLDRHPGRFFKVELSSGSIARHKVFITENRTYQIVFISRGKGVPAAVLSYHEVAAEKFLGSFKFR